MISKECESKTAHLYSAKLHSYSAFRPYFRISRLDDCLILWLWGPVMWNRTMSGKRLIQTNWQLGKHPLPTMIWIAGRKRLVNVLFKTQCSTYVHRWFLPLEGVCFRDLRVGTFPAITSELLFTAKKDSKCLFNLRGLSKPRSFSLCPLLPSVHYSHRYANQEFCRYKCFCGPLAPRWARLTDRRNL